MSRSSYQLPLHQRGLSLLELMVAAAIVAILIAPLVSGLIQNSFRSIGINKDITFASYAAQNHIAELQLAPKWPSIGKKEGDVEIAGREWQWQHQVFNTDDEQLRRVEVTIIYGQDATWMMTGFVEKKP